MNVGTPVMLERCEAFEFDDLRVPLRIIERCARLCITQTGTHADFDQRLWVADIAPRREIRLEQTADDLGLIRR